MQKELGKIKEYYGEEMMHFCRSNFSTILETPGLLLKLLEDTFDHSHFLLEDIRKEHKESEFRNLIYSKIKNEKNEKNETDKTPEELLDEAGYKLYECKTEEDIQKFRHYYYRPDGITPRYKKGTTPRHCSGEELCTFSGDRLDRCYVFFAVKKNIDEIKRENFLYPERQDEYGTSIISIQFTKDGFNEPSIKNRYNHTVNNPDATFSNNLDNIIPGLTHAFNKKYKLKIELKNYCFELKNYVLANDNRYYKFNYELNNTYYCTNNVIVDNFTPKKFDKAKYIVFDYFLIDMHNKIIHSKEIDSFPNTISNNGMLGKLYVGVDPNKKTRYIKIDDDIVIELNKYNQMIGYTNKTIKTIPSYFLRENKTLESLNIPAATLIGNDCLEKNRVMEKLSLPNVEKIGDDFFYMNTNINYIEVPKLKSVGAAFMKLNEALKSVSFDSLECAWSGFLDYNSKIENAYFPKLKRAYNNFMNNNKSLREFNAPVLSHVDDGFLRYNNTIKKFNAPCLEYVGADFLQNNNTIESIDLSNVKIFGNNCLENNFVMKEINIDSAVVIGNKFMCNNEGITNLSAPNLERTGTAFFYGNPNIKNVYFPKLKVLGGHFMSDNNSLKTLNLPAAKEFGDCVLIRCRSLKHLNVPNLIKVNDFGTLNYCDLLTINGKKCEPGRSITYSLHKVTEQNIEKQKTLKTKRA